MRKNRRKYEDSKYIWHRLAFPTVAKVHVKKYTIPTLQKPTARYNRMLETSSLAVVFFENSWGLVR